MFCYRFFTEAIFQPIILAILCVKYNDTYKCQLKPLGSSVRPLERLWMLNIYKIAH